MPTKHVHKDGLWFEIPVKEKKHHSTNWRKGQVGETRPKKVTQLSNDEKVVILTMSQAGKSVDEVAKAVDRPKNTVSRFLVKMSDTSVLAKAVIKAGAVTLAQRVVAKAEVREAIDVLSRPGMGVIEPVAPKGGNQGFGIQVSVGVASCGTVIKIEGGSNNGLQQLGSGNGQGDGEVASGRTIEGQTVPSQV